eukprot:1150286-Pelagomonas_calceolata.AAC.12
MAARHPTAIMEAVAQLFHLRPFKQVVKYRTPSGESRIRSLFQLSGGERRRVALALCLAFADLVKQYGRLSCNILVLDEVRCDCWSESFSCVLDNTWSFMSLTGLGYKMLRAVQSVGLDER